MRTVAALTQSDFLAIVLGRWLTAFGNPDYSARRRVSIGTDAVPPAPTFGRCAAALWPALATFANICRESKTLTSFSIYDLGIA